MCQHTSGDEGVTFQQSPATWETGQKFDGLDQWTSALIVVEVVVTATSRHKGDAGLPLPPPSTRHLSGTAQGIPVE